MSQIIEAVPESEKREHLTRNRFMAAQIFSLGLLNSSFFYGTFNLESAEARAYLGTLWLVGMTVDMTSIALNLKRYSFFQEMFGGKNRVTTYKVQPSQGRNRFLPPFIKR